jgi:hypothetical protein
MTEPEDWGTWQDAARRKYLKGLDLTVAERLAWLDEMIALAESRGATPKARDEWGQPIVAASSDPAR